MSVVGDIRFVEAPVVAALIRRPRGEIFLVSRKGKWTLPTGKFEREKEQELIETVLRELGEEVFKLGELGLTESELIDKVKEYIFIIGILNVLPLEAEDSEGGGKEAVVVVFLCETTEEGAKEMTYQDGDEKDFCWVVPSQALIEDQLDGISLDRLAKRAIKIYLESSSPKGKAVRMTEWLREGLRIFFEKDKSSK